MRRHKSTAVINRLFTDASGSFHVFSENLPQAKQAAIRLVNYVGDFLYTRKVQHSTVYKKIDGRKKG